MRNSTKSLFTLFLLLFLVSISLTSFSCRRPDKTRFGRVVQIKGSDTMVNLNQEWVEAYLQNHPKARIAVTGGGSGTGISAMINGTAHIAASSREMKEEEKKASAKAGYKVDEYLVAHDGLAVVVNKNNPVEELTLEQIADIFSGKLKNWQEVGGPNKKIVVLSRESNSGTHVYLKEHVLNKGKELGVEFAPQAQLMPSSQAIADEIATNNQAIGYFGLGYLGNLKAIKVKKDSSATGITPSVSTVQSGKYPISRPLFWYVREDAPELAQDLLEFVLSKEGQEIVKKLDFVPLENKN